MTNVVQGNPAEWIDQARRFTNDVRAEVRKVTWPTQQEYVGGTVGVLVIVALLTVVLGVIDWLLALGIQQVMP
jgi:preprotein translocase subunit SecE